MNITSEIIFDVDQPAQKFRFHHTGLGNRWRFLADATAVVLVPLCDSLCRPVAAPPLFDRLEIWPCCWGCPDFSRTNPEEYAELKRRFLAGEFPPQDIPMPPLDKREEYWPTFLEQFGEEKLWKQCATEEMKRQWLNTFDEFGPGFKLFMFAQRSPDERRTAEPTIVQNRLERIRFQAEFYNGENRQTTYLTDCKSDLLTPEEQRLSPGFIAQEEERLRKQMELAAAEAKNISERAIVAEQLKAAAKEVAKATEVADLYSNPSIADAKDAAIKQEIPKEFVAHCLTEWHVRKFPTTDQAWKAVQTLPLFRALRDPKTPSRTTVWRWLTIVRKELEKRGLLQPRAKGPALQEALHYDVQKRAAPALENAQQESERGGQTACDTRSQELDDPQGCD